MAATKQMQSYIASPIADQARKQTYGTSVRFGWKGDITLKTISAGRIWDGCENQRFMVIT